MKKASRKKKVSRVKAKVKNSRRPKVKALKTQELFMKTLYKKRIPKVKVVNPHPLESFRTYGKGGWTYHLPEGTPTIKKELKSFLAEHSQK